MLAEAFVVASAAPALPVAQGCSVARYTAKVFHPLVLEPYGRVSPSFAPRYEDGNVFEAMKCKSCSATVTPADGKKLLEAEQRIEAELRKVDVALEDRRSIQKALKEQDVKRLTGLVAGEAGRASRVWYGDQCESIEQFTIRNLHQTTI